MKPRMWSPTMGEQHWAKCTAKPDMPITVMDEATPSPGAGASVMGMVGSSTGGSSSLVAS